MGYWEQDTNGQGEPVYILRTRTLVVRMVWDEQAALWALYVLTGYGHMRVGTVRGSGVTRDLELRGAKHSAITIAQQLARDTQLELQAALLELALQGDPEPLLVD